MLELFLSRTLAFPDQLYEPFPFVRAQFDHIALLAHPRRRRFESRQKRIIHSIHTDIFSVKQVWIRRRGADLDARFLMARKNKRVLLGRTITRHSRTVR